MNELYEIREHIKDMGKVASISPSLSQEKKFRVATVDALTKLMNIIEKDVKQ